jgi:hypothetical protein
LGTGKRAHEEAPARSPMEHVLEDEAARLLDLAVRVERLIAHIRL